MDTDNSGAGLRVVAQPGTCRHDRRLRNHKSAKVEERTIREKWRDWELPAYRIGKHLRWKEREVYAWIDRHAA